MPWLHCIKMTLKKALARKYPRAFKKTAWQYVFPAKKRSRDPKTGKIMRHHVLESGLQKAVKRALKMSKDVDAVKSPLDSLWICGKNQCTLTPLI